MLNIYIFHNIIIYIYHLISDIPIKLVDEALSKYIMQCSNSSIDEELKNIQKYIRDFY